MKKSFLIRSFSSLAVLLLYFCLTPKTLALGLSPIRHEMNLAPGESESSTITLINDSEEEIEAEAIIRAFLKQDENGFPIPLDLEDQASVDIRQWIEFEGLPVTVPAKGSAEVAYTVNVPANAEPGGKYASIAFNPVKEDGDGLQLKIRVNSLLLINVEGEVIREADVTSFMVPEDVMGDQDFVFKINFENTGNTHLKPAGGIEIIDLSTNEPVKEVAAYFDEASRTEVLADKLPINIVGGNTLPDNSRTYDVPWLLNLREGDFKAVMQLNYGPGTKTIEKEINFSIKENLDVETFKLETNAAGSNFVLNIKNTGEIHEKLTGTIDVTNVFGYKVAEIQIPEDIEYVAPGESSEFKFSWIESDLPAGRYTATLNATYGLTDKALSEKVKFGQLNFTIIGLVSVIVLLLVILIIVIRRKK